MDPVAGPLVAAGGRIASSALRRPNLRRKASLRVESQVSDLGSTASVDLKMSNSRKNLDAVEVISVTPMLQIHDQSCGDAEHKALNHVIHAPFPALPLFVAPGETITWSAQLKKLDVQSAHRRLREAALRKTWGSKRFEDFTQEEERAKELRRRRHLGGRLARLVSAIDEDSPTLSMLVLTRQDGEYQTRLFRPWTRPLLVKLREAWAHPQ